MSDGPVANWRLFDVLSFNLIGMIGLQHETARYVNFFFERHVSKSAGVADEAPPMTNRPLIRCIVHHVSAIELS